MPSKKKVKNTVNILFPPVGVWGLGLLSLAVFALGQIQLFHGKALLGLTLSAAAILCGLVLYGGMEYSVKTRAFPRKGRSLPKIKAVPPLTRHLKGSLKNLSFLSLLRGGGILASFVLAGFGQYYLCQAGNGSTLATGSWFYLAAVFCILFAFWPWLREGLQRVPLSFPVEMILLGLILSVAVFLRSYQIASIPSGLFIDQGFEGYSALRILHEGWRPFYVEDIFHAYSLALYQLALWFGVFGTGEVSLKLFYAFLGILGFPLVYWTFRQLAGPRMALLTLFILAVMRWNINFCRNGFPTVQMMLYMFGTLAFLLYVLQPQKPNDKKLFYSGSLAAAAFFLFGVFPFAFLSLYWTLKPKSAVLAVLAVLLAAGLLAFMAYAIKVSKNRDTLVAMLLAAGFFTAGFYTYQAYKVFPLLVLTWALYESAVNWKTLRKNWPLILLFAALAVVLTLPVLSNPQTRETELSIFPHVRAEHSLKPLWDVVSRTAIMFNRQGDPNPRHNLQDYRMLDDVSGALMILGLAYALLRIKRRKYFYTLAGFFVMSLPCILSIDAAHANRLFAMTPFIAFLIATPFAAVWGRLRALGGGKGEWAFLILLVPCLAAMTDENFDVYFNKQAHSLACWNEYSIAETSAGRMVANHGGAYDYFVTPRYYNFYSLDFLAYPWLDQVKPLLLPDELISRNPGTSRGLYYALEQGRTGVLNMLKTLYPGGKDEYLVDPTGNTVEYFFRVPPEELAKAKGLTAHFDREVGGSKEMQVTQFPAGLPQGPYRANLSGNLYVPQTGDYRFDFQGHGKAVFRLKNQRATAKGFYHLDKGEHAIEVELAVPEGITPAITLQATTENGMAVVLDAGSFDSLPPPKGLLGSYFNSPQDEKPFFTEWDPILNFTNGNDFSVQPPPRFVRWAGSLEVEEAGTYRFLPLPNVSAQLKLDGRELPDTEPQVFLRKGTHSIEVDFGQRGRWDNFSFLWVKPDGKVEVVPNSVFGETR